ncbi:hypothetical protein [Georgenia alba]|uniref:L-fucose isomerase n=1 Tax=Georgenia alba TaxID=2233858 RepID=A0ABW2Q4P0_9MICO
MAATLLPVHLEDAPTDTFRRQLAALHEHAGSLATWLEPAPLGGTVPGDVSAVVVPDMSGVAYRRLADLQDLDVPILVVTSEFGTVSMWDWEIRDYLRRRSVQTVAPTSAEEFRDLCRALGLRERLRGARMLAYQDDLGAGMQPDIFKRFYWWEDECVADLEARFGLSVEHRSYRELAARAKAVPEDRVTDELRRIAATVPMPGLAPCAQRDAVRMYLALHDEVDETPDAVAVGVNCLNESASATTTPCLAFDLLYEERGLLWGCEADLTSMLTEIFVDKSLNSPVMMTNLYPFLMGQAALKHEGIPFFPEVPDHPENHVLVAHCGYFGEIPRTCAAEWACRPPVLEIIDENAHAIDARFPEGPTTLVKIASDLTTLTVCPAELTGYVQYEDSDCLNGGVLRVEDGFRFVESIPSHHTVLTTGDQVRRLQLVGEVLGLDVVRI